MKRFFKPKRIESSTTPSATPLAPLRINNVAAQRRDNVPPQERSSAATRHTATPSTEPGFDSTASEPASSATRALVLRMINETNRGTPLENQEVVDLLEGFQRAAGTPTGTKGSMDFMSALGNGTQDELCAGPWRWLLGVTRQASSGHDDLFVAHALFWAFDWRTTGEERFRPLLGIHLVGSIPIEVLRDLKWLAEQSLPRLPQDQVLFGDESGQITVRLLANAVNMTFG
jgi:hypothetical protein